MDNVINTTILEHVYLQSVYVFHKESKNVELSFRKGSWYAEEGYKYALWEKARSVLELEQWTANKENADFIISHVIKLFWGLEEYQSDYNLVSPENYKKAIDILDRNKKKVAPYLYDLFCGDKDEAVFSYLASLFANKMYDPLSVIAYLLFVKDKEKYATVRRQMITENLNKLSVSAACVNRCTWQDYMVYMGYVRQIHSFLLTRIPDATLLDAQSFLWMLWKIKPETPEYVCEQKPRVLFCVLSYMEHYDCIVYPEDKPVHGGQYVTDTGDSFEKYNFHQYADGNYYGFVETMYTAGNTADQSFAKQMHIERIDQVAKDKDSLDHVSVIFCAKNDQEDKMTIVGWYNDATVYRTRKETPEDGHIYNIKAHTAYLLPPMLRVKEVPKGKDEPGAGIGRARIWYADQPNALSYANEALSYVEKRSSEAGIYHDIVDFLDNSPDEVVNDPETVTKLSSYIPKTVNVWTRDPSLPIKAKRKSDGKCQLCKQPAPFVNKKGEPYLEAHHIIPLSENGLDAISNIAVLCPNCHRKMHILNDPEDRKALLGI